MGLEIKDPNSPDRECLGGRERSTGSICNESVICHQTSRAVIVMMRAHKVVYSRNTRVLKKYSKSRRMAAAAAIMELEKSFAPQSAPDSTSAEAPLRMPCSPWLLHRSGPSSGH